MPGKSPKGLRAEHERLTREVETLRLRLDEAEQALEAIRTGAAESLIVEGPNGPRIFSLEGADHSYRVLVEAMNEGAATLGDDGTILYCNTRFARMLDTELQRVMGSAIQSFLPERSREAFEAMVREANGGESRGEVGLLSQSGQAVPAYLSVSVIHGDTTRRLCLVAADLRAQKRTEEILAAERLARSVLDQAAEAIVVCDEQGRIIRASSTATQLCGRNPLRAPFGAAFPLKLELAHAPGSDGDLASHALRGLVLKSAPARLEYGDGSLAHLVVSAAPLTSGDNRTIGCVITMTDVSERRRAEEALRQSEEGFRSIANAIPQLAWVARPDGFIYWYNQRWYQFTGMTPEQLAGWGWQRLHDPEVLPKVLERWKASIASGEPFEMEFPLRGADGRFRRFLTRVLPLRAQDGSVLQWFGTNTDITDLAEAQAALQRANEQLVEVDRRKNEFLATLSHELRNPLAPIKNSIYVLERAEPGGDQARRAQAVIDRQVSQLARLVDDLLDVTRISRNKVHLKYEKIDLNEIVRRTVEDHRSLFDQAGIRLEATFAPNPVIVSADWARLAQAIGNLLANAAKFTPKGGTTQVEVARDGARRLAMVRVADTGAGMSGETLARLFQPFAQADRTLDRSKGGLGLGLALVKGLVEMHCGEVTAHSLGHGQGSEFRVWLPLDASAAVAAPVGPAERRRPRRLLIIEDNVDSADSLREVLTLEGHLVEVAYSGPEGLERARLFKPDLVLCDIGLPEMDGYQVARAFRADEALKAMHLVALSGYAMPEDLDRAAQSGFERHLAKPPSPEKIEETLHGLLG
ncbi:MAG TPA: PAS domain S-box protein [Myxococcales bacterium]